MTDNQVQQEARRWIDSLDNKWRLQILAKRQRFNVATGERREMPTRIRRFVEGIPWAYVYDGIHYLLSKSPYSGLVFNGVEIDGTYRPTLTTWNRDDQSTVNGQQRTDGTYTLIQDLLAIDEPDLYGSTSSASCSEEVVTEWHWDAPEPGDVPEPSQGVTWQIVAVSRGEDGAFDYALVKRTAITQHAGETCVKDNAFEAVYVDSWDNVYTDDEGRYVDNAGAPLDIPESGVVDGWSYEVTREINPDCTFKIRVARTEAKPVTTEESCGKTQFQHDHSVTRAGQESPLGPADEASGGVIDSHDDRLQPDGRYQTTEKQTIELPVADAEIRVTVGRRGKRVQRLDRNQAEPAPTEGLAVGQGVVVEKTPGKLYNNTRINFDLSDRQKVGESCRIDLYKHDHEETVAGVDGIPGPEEHVEGSGVGGDIKTRRTDMDDEGAVTQTNRVEHEKEVLKSREEWRVGLHGLRHSYTDTQTTPDRVPPPPAFSRESVGRSVSVEKTPGGLVNVTVVDLDRETGALDTGAGCAKTVFQHDDRAIVSDPSGNLDLGHVPDAGGGVFYENEVRLDDEGVATATRSTHRELEYPRADVEYRRTAKATMVRVTDRNTMAVATMPDKPGQTRSHKTNNGGTRDVTRIDVTPSPVPDRARCAQDVFQHSHDTVSIAVGAVDSSDTPAPGGGRYYRKDSTMDDDGVAVTVLTTTSEVERPLAEVTYRRVPRGLVKTTKDRNTRKTAADPGDGKVGNSESHSMNPGGTYDLTKVEVTATTVPDEAYCSRDVFLHAHDDVTITAGEVRDIDAKSPGGGHYYRRQSSVDELGFVKTVERDHEELLQADARLSYRKTVHGMVTSRTDRNTPQGAEPPTAIGGSSSHEMNPGGSYDTTTVTIDPTGEPDRAYCSRTVFEHAHDQVEVTAGALPAVEATAGGGLHQVIQGSVDEYGFATVVTRTTEELPQAGAEYMLESTPLRTTERVTDKNTGAPGTPGAAEENQRVVYRHQMNPGGSFDVTTETTTAVPKEWSASVATRYLVMETRGFVHQPPGKVQQYAQDVVNALSSRLGGEDKPIPSISIRPSVQYNEFGTVDGQVTGTLTYPSDSDGSDGVWQKTAATDHLTMVDATVSFNPYGNYLNTKERRVKWAIGYGWRELQRQMGNSKRVLDGSYVQFGDRASQSWSYFEVIREKIYDNKHLVETIEA